MVSTRSRSGIEPESALSKVVLPAPVAPATSTFQPGPHHPVQEPLGVGVDAELAHRHDTRTEPADGDARAVDRERREDGVEPRAVGEPRVDHR